MATPKQHDSKGKVGSRRSQKNLKKQNLHVCSECKSPKLAHRACPNCGAYKSKKKQTVKPEMKKEADKPEENDSENKKEESEPKNKEDN